MRSMMAVMGRFVGRRHGHATRGPRNARTQRQTLAAEPLEHRRVLAGNSYIYGISDSNQIYEVNVAAQTATSVFNAQPIIGSGNSNAFAYDTTRDQFFFIAPNNSLQYWNRGPNLVTLASNTDLGLPASGSQPANATFYNNAYWYFTEGTNTLNKVSFSYSGTPEQPTFASKQSFTVTGGPTSTNLFGDIAVNKLTGVLYAATTGGLFYSVDISSGSPTSYTAIGSGNPSLQLSFSSDYQTLYAQNFTGGQWYTVNTGTGAITTISGFTTPIDAGNGLRDLGGAADDPAPQTWLVAADDLGCKSAPRVYVINPNSGDVVSSFLAYADPSFRGGVRVAIGDLDDNGVEELVVAPGPGRAGEVKAFKLDGTPLPGFTTLPFGAGYRDGIELAVGDVDGDGKDDLVAAKSRGAGDVQVSLSDGTKFTAYKSFTAFAKTYRGGATVAVGGINTIVVGSGVGMPATVRTYDVSAAPTVVSQFKPASPGGTQGISVTTQRFTNGIAPEVMVAGGRNTGSVVSVYTPGTAAPIRTYNTFASLPKPNAPVYAAAAALTGGLVDTVFMAQGDGGVNTIKKVNATTGAVDATFAPTYGGKPLVSPLRIATRGPRQIT
jgi:hypothetical protein